MNELLPITPEGQDAGLKIRQAQSGVSTPAPFCIIVNWEHGEYTAAMVRPALPGLQQLIWYMLPAGEYSIATARLFLAVLIEAEAWAARLTLEAVNR